MKAQGYSERVGGSPQRDSAFNITHLYAPPQHIGFRVWHRTGAIGCFWRYRTGAMQDSGYGLPRTSLPRTRVHKGKKRGKDV
jgi:hypothetical protein